MTGTTKSPHHDELQWQHQDVRDLAWVLGSPPLLAPADTRLQWLDDTWSASALAASHEWLQQLDADPSPLLTALTARKDHRLGSHFEGLLAFWLAWPENPLYRLVGHALPVRDGNRTLGEIDFLVEERRSGELQHWEVAVKFYLGVRQGGALSAWVGPGLRDRLDIKVEHLRQRQLTLLRTPAGRALLRDLGLPLPTPVCLLKGRLFYPAGIRWQAWAPASAGPDHPRGWWMPQADFVQHHSDLALRWIRLPKQNWLTRVTPDVRIGDALSAPELIETLVQAADNRAVAVIGLDPDHNEVTRGFVTPPGWPQDSP